MKQPGMLELPVLGLLKERSMHGYELRKELGTMLGPFWGVSWGSLYPTLRRLAKVGAVEKVAEEPKPRRARAHKTTRATTRSTTRNSAGRRKTVYRITPLGDEAFRAMLEETGAVVDTEHFTLKLAFFRYLQPEMRVALLERRRAYLQEKLAQFKSNLLNYRERMDTYALSLQSHDMAATETDIAWIDELISKERAPQRAPSDQVTT
ncbi:MAG: PadR family transcriptional regulator [Actinomycetota bacterium]|nr:PadR family transcriptional regulator [Actinomycetota bacterium]